MSKILKYYSRLVQNKQKGIDKLYSKVWELLICIHLSNMGMTSPAEFGPNVLPVGTPSTCLHEITSKSKRQLFVCRLIISLRYSTDIWIKNEVTQLVYRFPYGHVCQQLTPFVDWVENFPLFFCEIDWIFYTMRCQLLTGFVQDMHRQSWTVLVGRVDGLGERWESEFYLFYLTCLSGRMHLPCHTPAEQISGFHNGCLNTFGSGWWKRWRKTKKLAQFRTFLDRSRFQLGLTRWFGTYSLFLTCRNSYLDNRPN